MGRIRDGLAGLRARLAARPDTEHEQALVRLLIGALLVLYLLPDARNQAAEPQIYVLLAYLAAAASTCSGRTTWHPGMPQRAW